MKPMAWMVRVFVCFSLGVLAFVIAYLVEVSLAFAAHGKLIVTIGQLPKSAQMSWVLMGSLAALIGVASANLVCCVAAAGFVSRESFERVARQVFFPGCLLAGLVGATSGVIGGTVVTRPGNEFLVLMVLLGGLSGVVGPILAWMVAKLFAR